KLASREDLLRGGLTPARRPLDDCLELTRIGRIDDHLEKEAIDLGLGQGVGTFHLDWILRGHYKKGSVELVCGAPDGDRALLHGFEEGGLCFGCSPVDLVGKDQVGKDRTLLKVDLPVSF